MSSTTVWITHMLAVGAIGCFALLLVGLQCLVLVNGAKKKNVPAPEVAVLLVSLLEKYALVLSFLLAFGGMVGSLYYSDVVGFAPCTMCWYQRVCLYPLVFMFALAMIRREAKIVAPYAMVLSGIGALLALDHHLLQVGLVSTSLCATSADSVSCAQRFVYEFGFLTMPLMACISFLLIGFLQYLQLRKRI